MAGRAVASRVVKLAQRQQELLAMPKEKLVELTKPQFVNGRWRKPKLNNRALNGLRKHAISIGAEWPFEQKPIKTSWPTIKGHKKDAEKIERQKTVEANMAKMDKLVAEHRQAAREARREKRMAKSYFWHDN